MHECVDSTKLFDIHFIDFVLSAAELDFVEFAIADETSMRWWGIHFASVDGYGSIQLRLMLAHFV